MSVALLALGSSMIASAQDSISVDHIKGNVTLPISPKRVAILDFGILDTMDQLGVDIDLAVPQTLMPSYLSKYQSDKYADLGGLKEFNLETLNAFKPDCIIISTRQGDYYDELSKIAPVYVVNRMPADQMQQAKDDILLVGKLFQKEEEAKKAIAEIDAAVARTKEKATACQKRALVILTNDGKISAYGAGSRFGMVHDALGVWQADTNIAISAHGQQVNYEYIATLNPDIIYVVDRSVAIGQPTKSTKLKENALISRTKAAQNNAIIMLDPAIWYLVGGGIHSTATMIKEIEQGVEATQK